MKMTQALLSLPDNNEADISAMVSERYLRQRRREKT